MTKYIDIILTDKKEFCIAPMCQVYPGYLVSIGDGRLQRVEMVCTEEENGDMVQMIEKFCGHELPKVKERFFASELEWRDE